MNALNKAHLDLLWDNIEEKSGLVAMWDTLLAGALERARQLEVVVDQVETMYGEESFEFEEASSILTAMRGAVNMISKHYFVTTEKYEQAFSEYEAYDVLLKASGINP